MTTRTEEQIAADLAEANTRIDSAIDALLAIRSLVAARPDIARRIQLGASRQICVHVGNTPYGSPERRIDDVPGRIAGIATAAARHGATLTPHHDKDYGGIKAKFGPFELYIYAPVDQVGTRILRQVTEWTMDARLTALQTPPEAEAETEASRG